MMFLHKSNLGWAASIGRLRTRENAKCYIKLFIKGQHSAFYPTKTQPQSKQISQTRFEKGTPTYPPLFCVCTTTESDTISTSYLTFCGPSVEAVSVPRVWPHCPGFALIGYHLCSELDYL